MSSLLKTLRADTQVTVWLVLIGATAATALLGVEQGADAPALVGLALLAIALVKIRLVGIHFMELGRAPLGLRLLFEGYVLVTFTVLAVLFVVI